MKKLLLILFTILVGVNSYSKTRYIDLIEELDSANFVGEVIFIGYDSIKVEANPHKGTISIDSVYNIHYAYFINTLNRDTIKFKPMDHWHNENYYKERPEQFSEKLASNGYWPKFGDTCLVVINKENRISLFAKIENKIYTFWDPYFNTSWTSFMSYNGPFDCTETFQKNKWLKNSSKSLAVRHKREGACAFHLVITKKLFWEDVMKNRDK